MLGIRDHANTLDIATHMDKATAHKVLVHAPCPVLTARGLRCTSKTWTPVMEVGLMSEVAPRSCSVGIDSTAEKMFGDGLWKTLVSKHRIQ